MSSDRHFKYKNKLYSFYSIFHSAAAAAAIIVSLRNIHIIEWDVFLLSLLRLASGMCVCVWLPWRSYAITFYVAAHCCRMSICAITAPAIFSVFAYISFLCEYRIQFYIEINIRASNRVWARRNDLPSFTSVAVRCVCSGVQQELNGMRCDSRCHIVEHTHKYLFRFASANRFTIDSAVEYRDIFISFVFLQFDFIRPFIILKRIRYLRYVCAFFFLSTSFFFCGMCEKSNIT